MADGITELAILFKERDNKPPISFVVGTVKSAEPLVIAPEGINFSLGIDDLIIPKWLTKYDEEIKASGTVNVAITGLLPDNIDGSAAQTGFQNQAITIHHEGLKLYERVALLPSADGQKYFVMDRVVV